MLKAPVDSAWSLSNISCSSFGSRGGDGPVDHADLVMDVLVKVRRKKPGRIVRMILLVVCMMKRFVRNS